FCAEGPSILTGCRGLVSRSCLAARLAGLGNVTPAATGLGAASHAIVLDCWTLAAVLRIVGLVRGWVIDTTVATRHGSRGQKRHEPESKCLASRSWSTGGLVCEACAGGTNSGLARRGSMACTAV